MATVSGVYASAQCSRRYWCTARMVRSVWLERCKYNNVSHFDQYRSSIVNQFSPQTRYWIIFRVANNRTGLHRSSYSLLRLCFHPFYVHQHWSYNDLLTIVNLFPLIARLCTCLLPNLTSKSCGFGGPISTPHCSKAFLNIYLSRIVFSSTEPTLSANIIIAGASFLNYSFNTWMSLVNEYGVKAYRWNCVTPNRCTYCVGVVSLCVQFSLTFSFIFHSAGGTLYPIFAK